MFTALCNRRNIRLKHERYSNALTAAAVYNVNRATTDVPMISAFDFVRDAESSKARSEEMVLKRQIKDAIDTLPCNTPREAMLDIRRKIVDKLKGIGRTDAEELWADVWPSLVPEGEQCQ